MKSIISLTIQIIQVLFKFNQLRYNSMVQTPSYQPVIGVAESALDNTCIKAMGKNAQY